jgi:vancomycin resistance protein YoaR
LPLQAGGNMEREKEQGNMTKKKSLILKILLTAAVVLLIGAIAGVSYIRSMMNEEGVDTLEELMDARRQIPEGVTIDGISVAQLTRKQAGELLHATEAPRFGLITITNGEKEFQLDASTVPGVRNIDEMIEQAIAFGEEEKKSDSIVLQDWDLKTTAAYDTELLRQAISDAARELSWGAVDATVKMDPALPEPFVYTPEQDGSRVLPDVLFEQVNAYLNGQGSGIIVATAEPVKAGVTEESLRGSFTLISSASSSFAKSSYSKANRVFNITKAAEMINGTVLQPGESFSFNDVLGPRKSSTGWKVAGAINNGKSVDEVGGGICQVSSTVFNAVLMADLEVVTRFPHSYPLSYLPAGQDATISTGGPDFVFRNNKETPVVLIARVDPEEKSITAEFYGEELPDGMTIKLVSEKQYSIPEPASETTVNPLLPAGSQETVRPGRSGSKWDTYKEYYIGDTMVDRVLSHSSVYRAIGELIEVGPAVPAAGTGGFSPADGQPA